MNLARLLPLALVLLLAGCSGPPPVPTAHPLASVARALPLDASDFTVLSNATGIAALRVTFNVLSPTSCSILWAATQSVRYRSDSDPTFEMKGPGYDDESVLGAGWHPIVGGRMNVDGVDTQAYEARTNDLVSNATAGPLGESDRFTSWREAMDRPLATGLHNLTITARDLLPSPSRSVGLGSTMRIAMSCKKPVRLLATIEDRATLLLWSENMAGTTDILVEPAAIDIHEGSLQHSATAATNVFEVVHYGIGRGTVWLSGPTNATVAWQPEVDPNGRSHVHRSYIPAGNYTLSWSTLGANADEIIRIQSWVPLPPMAFIPRSDMPV